jgi:TonB family protein
MALELLVAIMAPGGAINTTEVISDTQHRTLFSKPTAIVPRGAVMIQGPDGTLIVDRANGRYWKLSASASSPPFGTYASTSVTATDDYETIAGLRARRYVEKVTLTQTDGIHVAATDMMIDIWLTEQFAEYTRTRRGIGGLTPEGDQRPRGYPLRTVMQGGALGPYRIVTNVISIREVPHQAAAFDIPAECVEVAAPPPDLSAAVPVSRFQAAAGTGAPHVVELAKPKYTPEAMRRRIEGVARVSAVVMPDGTVQDVHIVKSLDSTYGLDQAAVDAVKASKFQAGTRNGTAVPVAITIDVEFRVR